MAILAISRVFCWKKNYFNRKNYQNFKKPINTTKPQKRPLITAKLTKMHHEYLKYPKTLKNDKNAPKTTTKPMETFKTTKIPLNLQNKQNTP